jgi:hypothetical protein
MTSAPAPGTADDERAFLLLVEQSRERRCLALLEAADTEARSLLRSARRDALARVRRAVREQRERQRSALEAVGAELSTQLRLLQQQVLRRWLDEARPRLIEVLEAHWQDAGRRRHWLNAVIELATLVLPTSARWRLQFPAELERDELDRVLRSMTERVGTEPELAATPELGPGLRIEAGGATVDGTIPGLLANLEQIEARLIAELGSGGAA